MAKVNLKNAELIKCHIIEIEQQILNITRYSSIMKSMQKQVVHKHLVANILFFSQIHSTNTENCKAKQSFKNEKEILVKI